ncbi:MAG: TIGR01458 family HAD-type hydrolase [Acidobacteriota bacterium]
MRAILLDLDGVVYNAERPIDGAAETVAWLQSESVPHLFVTNTSSRGRKALMEKLRRLGIRTDVSHILTPCSAASGWLESRSGSPVALFVKPEARGEFNNLDQLPESAETGARYIVIGDLSETWDFSKLNRAFRLLHSDPEAELIALGMTRFWKAEDGLRLDVAPFISALECATGKKARVFGKPAKTFYSAAAAQLQIPPDEIAMVGDDVEADVAGAQHAGMKGILVRTGKFHPSDVKGSIRPDEVLDSIREIPAYWKRSKVKGPKSKV